MQREQSHYEESISSLKRYKMKQFISLLIAILLTFPTHAAQTPGVNSGYYFTGEVQLRGESANSVLYLDADKKIQSNSAVTPTELSYLDGVTSSIQSQFTGKMGTATLSDERLIRGDGTAAIQASGITVTDADVISGAFLSGSTNTFTNIPLSTGVTGLLPLANGGTNQDNSSVVFPASGTIPTLTSTSAFTNKDYDGGTASNTSRLTLPKAAKATLDALTRKEGTIVYGSDTDKVYYDDGAILNEVGSGAAGGASFVKWITNYNAESSSVGTTGWSLYADAAGTSPVDGTAGTATGMTFTRTTTSGEVMIGTASYELAKDAANRQGMGVSYDFTIDDESLVETSNKVTLTLPYNTTGNYSSGDVIAYVYDRDGTTVQLCRNSNNGALLKATTRAKFQCEFFTTTSALAYDVRFEIEGFTNASPTPTAIAQDLGTETWADSQANATTSVKLSRVGNRLFVDGVMSFTGAAGTTASVTIPTIYTPDSTVYNSAIGINKLGGSYFYDASAATAVGEVVLSAVNTITVFMYNPAAAGMNGIEANVTATSPWTWASGDKITFQASWIVTNWNTGNVISSTEAAYNTIKFRASGDPASASSGNPYIFPTVAYDTGGGYNSTTGRYTWPKKSCLRIHGYASSGTAGAGVIAYVNAASIIQLGKGDSTSGDGSYSGTVCVNAGDIIDIRANATIDLDSTSVYNIEEVPDFNVFGVYNSVRTVYAYLGTSCVSTPCAVDTFSGVSTVTRASTGNYTATFNPPFPTVPACTFAPGGAVNAFAFMAPTTTNVNIIARTVTTTPVAADTNFSIICTGSQ
jgi:hypothetical protein